MTRIRSRSSVVGVPLVGTTTWCNNTVTTFPMATPLVGLSEKIVDTVTPNFKARSAKGEVIVNELLIEKFDYQFSPSAWTLTNVNQSCTGSTNIKRRVHDAYFFGLGYQFYPVSFFKSEEDPAIRSLIAEAITSARARASEPPVETLVELAEARRTVNGLAQTAEDFRQLVFNLRRSRAYREWLRDELDVTTGRRSARRDQRLKEKMADEYAQRGLWIDRFIAQRWLEYRYQFTPLVLTGKSVLTEWNNRSKEKADRQTYRAFKYQDFNSEYSTPRVGAYWKGDVVHTSRNRVGVRAGSLQDLRRSACLSGASFTDVPASAWELIPFSFVVDWFTNVGDFLRAVSPVVGRVELGSWVTVVQEVAYSVSEQNAQVVGPGTYTYSSGGANVTVDAKRIHRIPSPGTDLTLRRSRVSTTTELKRLADIAALAMLALYPKLSRNKTTT